MSSELETPVQGPSPGAVPGGDTPPPTAIDYQKLVENFMKGLDGLLGMLGPLESPHPVNKIPVRGRAAKREFMVKAVAAADLCPSLRIPNVVDPVAGQDILQSSDAYKLIENGLFAAGYKVQFTRRKNDAVLSKASRKLYAIAKGLNRDPDDPLVLDHVQAMKAALGKTGRKKKTTTPAPQPHAELPAPIDNA
jgi:hypothetical protein